MYVNIYMYIIHTYMYVCIIYKFLSRYILLILSKFQYHHLLLSRNYDHCSEMQHLGCLFST